ncbi:diguanylate cyclase domain protein [Ostertagia ostertagi]
MSAPYSTPDLQPPVFATDTPLQRTLREQQTLLDSAGVGIVFLRQRSVVRCNQRYAEIFGYASAERLVGLNTEAFYPHRDAFRELGRSAYPVLVQGQSFRVERQLRRHDGSLFWGSLTGRLINPQDTSEGSIWIVDDIDEHKRAQAALTAAVREKQLLFDSAMVGIVFLRDRRLTRCNKHFEQMLGYEPGELMGSPSRRWYASDAAWKEVGSRCYPNLEAGHSYEGEVELCRKDGTAVICEVRSKSIDPADPAQGSIWITMDITERKQAQAALARAHEELEQQVQDRTRELRETVDNLHREINDRKADQDRIYWLAHYDALTGLPNRALLAERASEAIRVSQQGNTPLAVIFLDLDHFKHVNDSLGHRVGDVLLVEIAKRLRAVVREKDTVSRLGGDEFILLLPGANAHGAARVAGKLQEASRHPYQIDHHELTMAPSMGIALFPQDGADFDTLTQSADVAMYRAKLDGRNTFRFFTPRDAGPVRARAAAGKRAAPRAGARAVPAALPAADQPGHGLRAQRGGPAALEAPAAGRCITSGIHPDRGRQRTDPADRGMGAAHGTGTAERVAPQRLSAAHHGGEPLGHPVPPTPAARTGQSHADRIQPAA